MRVIKVSIAKGFVVDGDKPAPPKNSIDLAPLKQITEGLINNQSPEVPQALEPIAESIKLILAKINAIKPGESKDYTAQFADIDNQIKSTLRELESVKRLQINYNSNNQSLAQEIAGYRAQVESLGNWLSSLGSAISNLLTQDEFTQHKNQIEQSITNLQSNINSATQEATGAKTAAAEAKQSAESLKQSVDNVAQKAGLIDDLSQTVNTLSASSATQSQSIEQLKTDVDTLKQAKPSEQPQDLTELKNKVASHDDKLKTVTEIKQSVDSLSQAQDSLTQKQTQLEQATGELSKKIDNLPKGGGQSVEPEYVSEIGEITFNANGYPFTDNKVMFQNSFTDIPYIDVMIAYTDGTIISVYPGYALYDVDKSGFKCRITNVLVKREWIAKYKATGKVK